MTTGVLEMAEEASLPFAPVVDRIAIADADLSLADAVLGCFPGLVMPLTDTPGRTMVVATGPDEVTMLHPEEWWYRQSRWTLTTLTLSLKNGPLTRARRTETLDERADILTDILDAALDRMPARLSTTLHLEANDQNRPHFFAMASLWHDLRVREGHSPESAFFLLRLRLVPARAAYLSLDGRTGRLVLDPQTPHFLPA